MVYISKQQILTRFRRYKALNETRLQRACALMGAQARKSLAIVPLFLHYNHIALPGYRSGYIPHGIDLFTPDAEQRQYLHELLQEGLSGAFLDHDDAPLATDSEALAQRALEQEQAELERNEFLAQIPPLAEPSQHDILGLYAMGSTSSLGQSQGSDLDIWVCVRANISPDGMTALQDKCRFITTYVKSFGVELNLFVTPEDRFTNFQPDQLDEENCGSAQNMFLLDEFYRSSIRLCGRYIIWYLIASNEEQSSYQDYVKFLLEGKSNLPKFCQPQVNKVKDDAESSGISTHGMSHVLMSSLMGNEEAYRQHNQHSLEHLMEVPSSEPFDPNALTEDSVPAAASEKNGGALSKVKDWYLQLAANNAQDKEDQPLTTVSLEGFNAVSESGGNERSYRLRSALSGLTNHLRPGRGKQGSESLEPLDDKVADTGFELNGAAVYPASSLGQGPDSGAALRDLSSAAPRDLSEISAAEQSWAQPLDDLRGRYGELSPQDSATLAQSLSARRDVWPAFPQKPEVSAHTTDKQIKETSGFERLAAAMGVSAVPLWGNNVTTALSFGSKLNLRPVRARTRDRAAETEANPYADSYLGPYQELNSQARVASYQEDGEVNYVSADVREVRSQPHRGRVSERPRRFGSLPSLEQCQEMATRDGWVEGEAPLDASEWFDFGSVVKSSPTEYFGSGLWLLYKGIDSPFKVVLKILLMEAYSSSYPNTRLLSSELKDYMLSHDGYSLDLDSYYLMYLKVSQYLQECGQTERLELMRKCFYLKLFMGLNQHSASHRDDYNLKRELLDKLSSRWGWTPEFLSELENVSGWKMNQARRFNREVFNTLIESYLALLRFSVRHGIEYAITSDDAGVLSRRLYAAFDRYPGKILVMHTSLFHNLEERHLTFICPSPNSLCRKGWHLYTAANYDIGLLNQRVTYIGARLCETVAWACFNGLLTPRTKIHVAGFDKGVTPAKIKQLSSDIMRVLGPSMTRVSEQSMQRGFRLKSCVVVVNLEEDNTSILKNQVLAMDYGSTLCCGHQRLCLVGSLDLIMVNTWGEAIAINLPGGEEGVVELLATLLRIVTNSISLTPTAPEPKGQGGRSGQLSKMTQASALAQAAIGIGAQSALLGVGARSMAYAEGLVQADEVHHSKHEEHRSQEEDYRSQEEEHAAPASSSVVPGVPPTAPEAIVMAQEGLLGALAPKLVEGENDSPAETKRAIASSEELMEILSHIEVCSYAEYCQDLIKYDLEATVRQVCNCLLSTGSSEYVFEVGRNTYIARNVGERGVKINRKSVFGSNEFDISVLSGYGMRPEYALQVPPIVDRYANTGIVQYFFMPLPDKGHWDIYILNERNEVTIYHDYYGSRSSLVNAINRFYTQQGQNRVTRSARFNLPQYYVLSQDQRSLHPFTIKND